MILLASGSPRRREILQQIGVDFFVYSSEVDESTDPRWDPLDSARQLAMRKALAASALHPEVPCLGFDTIVHLGPQLLGKPSSVSQAKAMLQSLRGTVHMVRTGIALASHGRILESATESTAVWFRNFSDSELESYISSSEPYDKAGGYGIQGKGARLVQRIEGCYYNVVGLPVALTLEILHRQLERL